MTRKPSLLWFAPLCVAGAVGLRLMVHVSIAFVIGVVGVSAAIVALSLRRWPPDEWLARPKRIRQTRPPTGGMVAAAGTLFGFLGLIGVASDATGALRVLLLALVAVVSLAVWMQLARVYAGPRPARTD